MVSFPMQDLYVPGILSFDIKSESSIVTVCTALKNICCYMLCYRPFVSEFGNNYVENIRSCYHCREIDYNIRWSGKKVSHVIVSISFFSSFFRVWRRSLSMEAIL